MPGLPHALRLRSVGRSQTRRQPAGYVDHGQVELLVVERSGAMSLSDKMLVQQEETFAHMFGSTDVQIGRPLYHPDVVYISPTVRLFGWPQRIHGVERTLEFIALTIKSCEAIAYRAVEYAIVKGGDSAFVRIH